MRHRFDPFDDDGRDWPREVEVCADERDDRVIFGPRGEVVHVVRDRPFRGYRR